MRPLLAGLLAVAVLGCGAGQGDDGDLDPVQVATAWVEAVNERDYRRACELSVRAPPNDPACEELLEGGFGDVLLERPEGAYFNQSGEQPAHGSFSAARRGGGAPVTFMVEEQGGRYLVHFEVSVIR